MLPRLPLLLVVASALATAPLTAQCTTVWSAGSPQPELTGLGRCSTLWDPDGTGPAPERLVIGGSELRAGDEPLDQRVMTWDGSAWQSLGPGPGTNAGGRVDAFAVWNGALVAGGTFTGGGTDRVARWNGSAWQALGPGFPAAVTGLAVFGGELVAVGSTGATPVIQRWNGNAWTALPAPPSLQQALAVTAFQGLLCVGGSRTSSPAGGVLERWNGTAWLPAISASDTINCFAVRSFSLTLSSLYVAGSFSTIGGVAATHIAVTAGGTAFSFSSVGGGLPAPCSALHVRASVALGTAIVACLEPPAQFFVGFPPPGHFIAVHVMQLTNAGFEPMGDAEPRSVSYYGGAYHGVSAATTATSTAACQRYQAAALGLFVWTPVAGPGISGNVHALTASGDDMIVGGTISAPLQTALDRVARWNGSAFQPLGSGISGTSVDALLTLGNGDIVAGGLFTAAGGVGANNVARWNGTAWLPLGTGTDQQVQALCRLPNGGIVAGGKFAMAGGVACARIARWSGSAWAPLGTGMNGEVMAVAARSDGTLVAGGAFTTAGGVACNNVAQWNGTAWLPLGAGTNGSVLGLAVRDNGDVVAVGTSSSAGGIAVDRCALWNGSTWTSMGAASGDDTPVHAVIALPNGDVIAGRGFHQPTADPDAGISRSNGGTWSGLGSGLAGGTPVASILVRAIAMRANGDIIVGGDFRVAGGLLSPSLAVLSSSCPATAQPYGAGCSSPAGLLSLTTEALPWIGGTFRTATTGVAPGSFCFGVTGFAQVSIPLQSLLAQGQPGCPLLASPDLVTLLPQGVTGVAHSALALPPNASLVGLPFSQQSVTFEFTGLFVLAAVRSSNALALTIGAL